MPDTITRIQASIPRPPLCDGIVWIDLSTKEQVLFVTEKLGDEFDQAFLVKLAGYTGFSVYDGDEATAGRVDALAAKYRATLAQIANPMDADEAAQLRKDIADLSDMNERLRGDNRRLQEENVRLQAQQANPVPRTQPDDIPENPESMDDLRLPDVPPQAEAASSGRRRRG